MTVDNYLIGQPHFYAILLSMRLAHISDLHLGKQLKNFSLIEDQDYILQQIVSILKEKEVNLLMVAGDVFDKSVASIEGLKLFRKFLNSLVANKITVLIISGNHDSSERLTFGAEFMEDKNIYFSKIYDGKVEPLKFTDEFGSVNFYLLPFIKVSEVRHFFPEEKIEDYNDALKVAVKNLNINTSERNIIIAHQAIASAQRCDSEESVIGGLDNVSAEVFKDFDYTALGHIHTPQKISENVIYCGSPLKYSASEIQKDKSMPVIDILEKGNISIEYVPLVPLRDIREIKGEFREILEMSQKDPYNREDYINIILTNKTDVLDAISDLRQVYPNILQLTYERELNPTENKIESIAFEKHQSPLELFEDFYRNRQGEELSDEQKSFMQNLIETVWREN